MTQAAQLAKSRGLKRTRNTVVGFWNGQPGQQNFHVGMSVLQPGQTCKSWKMGKCWHISRSATFVLGLFFAQVFGVVKAIGGTGQAYHRESVFAGWCTSVDVLCAWANFWVLKGGAQNAKKVAYKRKETQFSTRVSFVSRQCSPGALPRRPGVMTTAVCTHSLYCAPPLGFLLASEHLQKVHQVPIWKFCRGPQGVPGPE